MYPEVECGLGVLLCGRISHGLGSHLHPGNHQTPTFSVSTSKPRPLLTHSLSAVFFLQNLIFLWSTRIPFELKYQQKNWNPASIKTFIKSCCSWLWQCFLFFYSVSTLSLAEVANYENPTHVVCRCCLTLPSLSLIDSYSITSCCLTSCCCCCCCCYPSPPQYIGYNICVVAFSLLFYSVIIIDPTPIQIDLL